MSMLPPPQPSSSSKVLNTVNTLVRNGHPLWEILAPSRLLPNRVTTAPPAGPRLAPSDRNAAALRALLHDAKATLEGFSGRFGTLTTDVTAALKEILGVAKSSETSKKEHLTQIMSASAY